MPVTGPNKASSTLNLLLEKLCRDICPEVESLAEIEKQKGMDMQMKEAPRCAGHV
jgi:hypothetical protein